VNDQQLCSKMSSNNSFNRLWRNRYNLNTPLRGYNRSPSTLVSDCRPSAPKTTATPGLFTYPPMYIYMYMYMYMSCAVNQHVTTRQRAADPARRTRLFPTFYQNNKHVIRLARSKPHIQILVLSRLLSRDQTPRILNMNQSIAIPDFENLRELLYPMRHNVHAIFHAS